MSKVSDEANVNISSFDNVGYLDETYATADEAKAAAQADHIARIRSALITETDNG